MTLGLRTYLSVLIECIAARLLLAAPVVSCEPKSYAATCAQLVGCSMAILDQTCANPAYCAQPESMKAVSHSICALLILCRDPMLDTSRSKAIVSAAQMDARPPFPSFEELLPSPGLETTLLQHARTSSNGKAAGVVVANSCGDALYDALNLLTTPDTTEAGPDDIGSATDTRIDVHELRHQNVRTLLQLSSNGAKVIVTCCTQVCLHVCKPPPISYSVS